MKKTVKDENNSIFKHMLRGSIWAVLMRWSVRGIGLISTVILARLLTPQDFGIVAMGSLVIGFLRLFSEMGPEAYVIRAREATSELCDTAWTIRVLQGFVIGGLLVIGAPLAVAFFGEPRLTSVFYVMAIVAALSGFQNIGMTLVRKDLDFAKDFRFMVYRRLLKFAATVPLAFVLQSYWALIFGMLFSAIATLPLSFAMHPYRPRLRLYRTREILVFGASMLLANTGRFINEKADVLLIGHIATTAGMGRYNVAAELGTMATNEIAAPIRRGLFPSYSKVADDRPLLKRAYLKSLGIIALLCIPLGVGISSIAEDAVKVLLGDQWLAAAPFLRWLAIYALLNSLINSIIGRVLVVIGREWLSSALRWIRVGALIPSILVAAYFWGVDAVPIAATLSAAAVFPVIGYTVFQALGIAKSQLVTCLWRPVVAVILMAAVIYKIHPVIDDLFLRTFFEIIAGAVTYMISLLCLWWLSGKPDDAIKTSYDVLAKKLRPTRNTA